MFSSIVIIWLVFSKFCRIKLIFNGYYMWWYVCISNGGKLSCDKYNGRDMNKVF